MLTLHKNDVLFPVRHRATGAIRNKLYRNIFTLF